MSDFMPAPHNCFRFEFRTIGDQISLFEHLKRVLMMVDAMLEPRNSKRPLFGRIFQPLIDALRDTDMNTRLDFLPIDFIVRKCNYMVMEWGKLQQREQRVPPLRGILGTHRSRPHRPGSRMAILLRNQPLISRQNQIPGKHFVPAPTDDPSAKRQRVNLTTPAAGNNAAAKARQVESTGRRNNSRLRVPRHRLQS